MAFSITLNTVQKVVQRSLSTGLGSITLSGTQTDGTSIEARVVDYTTKSTVVTAWTTINASPGVSWSGTLTGIPSANHATLDDMYCIQVRLGNNTGTTADSGEFGVGAIVVVAGQSNGAYLFYRNADESATPDATIPKYQAGAGLPKFQVYGANGFDTITGKMDGVIAYANSLQVYDNVPVCFIYAAVGGTGLDANLYTISSIPCWLDLSHNYGGGSTTLYQRMVDFVIALGGNVEEFVWYQGEADAVIYNQKFFSPGDVGYSDPPAAYDWYKENLQTLASWIRRDIRSDLPMLVCTLARHYNTSNADQYNMIPEYPMINTWDEIRRAQRDFTSEDGNSFYLDTQKNGLRYDAPEYIHLDIAGRAAVGTRLGYLHLHQRTPGPYPYSPLSIIKALDVDSTHTQVELSGSTLTPVTGITGFVIWDGDTRTTISAATLSGTTVSLTHSAVTGIKRVSYLAEDDSPGAHGTAPNILVDTTTLAWEVPSYRDIPISTPVVKTIKIGSDPEQKLYLGHDHRNKTDGLDKTSAPFTAGLKHKVQYGWGRIKALLSMFSPAAEDLNIYVTTTVGTSLQDAWNSIPEFIKGYVNLHVAAGDYSAQSLICYARTFLNEDAAIRIIGAVTPLQVTTLATNYAEATSGTYCYLDCVDTLTAGYDTAEDGSAVYLVETNQSTLDGYSGLFNVCRGTDSAKKLYVQGGHNLTYLNTTTGSALAGANVQIYSPSVILGSVANRCQNVNICRCKIAGTAYTTRRLATTTYSGCQASNIETSNGGTVILNGVYGRGDHIYINPGYFYCAKSYLIGIAGNLFGTLFLANSTGVIGAGAEIVSPAIANPSIRCQQKSSLTFFIDTAIGKRVKLRGSTGYGLLLLSYSDALNPANPDYTGSGATYFIDGVFDANSLLTLGAGLDVNGAPIVSDKGFQGPSSSIADCPYGVNFTSNIANLYSYITADNYGWMTIFNVTGINWQIGSYILAMTETKLGYMGLCLGGSTSNADAAHTHGDLAALHGWLNKSPLVYSSTDRVWTAGNNSSSTYRNELAWPIIVEVVGSSTASLGRMKLLQSPNADLSAGYETVGDWFDAANQSSSVACEIKPGWYYKVFFNSTNVRDSNAYIWTETR